jgi:hypothetical protein
LFEGSLAAPEEPVSWVFMWNHFADLDTLNDHVFPYLKFNVGIDATSKANCGYAARMKKTVGFKREWYFRGRSGAVGDQTITCLIPVDDPSQADDVVGVLYRLQGAVESAKTRLFLPPGQGAVACVHERNE